MNYKDDCLKKKSLRRDLSAMQITQLVSRFSYEEKIFRELGFPSSDK